MSKLSTAEEAYVEAGAADGVRVDGRGRMEMRKVLVQVGVLDDNCYGSARVVLGGTEVVVAISAELGETLGAEQAGRLEVSVASTPGASASLRKNVRQHIREQESFNELLAYRLREVLGATDSSRHERASEIALPMRSVGGNADSTASHSRQTGIDYSSLHVRDECCWVLSAFVNVLSNDGSCLAAASIAARAALITTRLPKVTVNPEVEGHEGIELSDHTAEAIEVPGARENVPVCITLAKIGSALIADPTLLEEACPLAVFHIGMSPALKVSSITTSGGAGTGAQSSLGATPSLSDIPALLRAAPGIAQNVFSSIDEQIESQMEE